MSSRGDQIVDRGAERLQQTAERLATEGGVKAKLANTLADDAAFLRKLKPSLIKARARGELPTDGPPARGRPAPPGPQLGRRPTKKHGGGAGDGPNPFMIVGIALVAGIVLAKVIDWRGHAHPRD